MQITGGYLKSRKIESPKGTNVRPTLSQVRESIFSILYSLTEFESSSFLDVFAGSGIMGFEAISRGFKEVDFIEKDKKTFFQIKHNTKKLNVNPQVHIGDALKIISKLKKTYDVIFIDPPYYKNLYNDVLKSIKESNILSPNGIVIIEAPKELEINTTGYKITKEKYYANKKLLFVSY